MSDAPKTVWEAYRWGVHLWLTLVAVIGLIAGVLYAVERTFMDDPQRQKKKGK